MPTFKDSDNIFEKHWRQFQYAMDLHVIGRSALRPIDVMTAYSRCLPAGSVRLTIFDTCVNKAQKNNLLPSDAAKVMQEIKDKLRRAIRETTFQWQDRVDREYDGLVMQGRSHAEFRSLFEKCIADMHEARIRLNCVGNIWLSSRALCVEWSCCVSGS